MGKDCYDPMILYMITNFTSYFIQNKSILELYFWANVFSLISDQITAMASLYVFIEALQDTSESSETTSGETI